MKQTKKVKHTKKSSSSEPTVPSKIPRDVLDLGRALVEELGLDPGPDTLSRWMAHYIVELIDDAETASVKDKIAKLEKCADAILNLWAHRYQLPKGKRPFEDLKPILRALESLDPTDDTPRYFRSTRMALDNTEQNDETNKWLELADGLDYSAKILIGFSITLAAQGALEGIENWVELAEAAGLDDDIDFKVIRFITGESDLLGDGEPNDSARRLLEDRIKRLENFIKGAELIVSDLRRKLTQEHVSNEDS